MVGPDMSRYRQPPYQQAPAPLSNLDSQGTEPFPASKENDLHSSDGSTQPLRQRHRGTTATSQHSHVRSALGLKPIAPIDEDHDLGAHHQNLWPRIRLVLREPFAEFWGTFIMVMFGNGSVAQVLLGEGITTAPGGNGYGNYQSIAWGWGLGVMLGIYVAGDSGAFLNPAITLAFCVYRGMPFRRWPIYLVAQFIGGFLASGVVYANYIPSIDHYAGVGVRAVPPSPGATAQIFSTYPAGTYVAKGQQFVSEFITSTLLLFVIFALKDESNMGAAAGAGNWFPLGLFFLIFGLGSCFGYETGYAINLARDFAPRVMSYAVGYGPEVWSAGDYYFWVPVVASFAGCLFGGFLYDFFIYTGPESPINSPYCGLPYLLKPWQGLRNRHAGRDAQQPAKDEETPRSTS